MTVQWYAPPMALVGLETSAYTVLVASQAVLLAEHPVPHKLSAFWFFSLPLSLKLIKGNLLT